MSGKWTVLAILIASVVVALHQPCHAVDVRAIETVRNKGVLDNRDLQIIDEFLAEAVRELVEAEDFSSMSKVRSVIVSRKSTKSSAREQYEEQFSTFARKHISTGLQQAAQFAPQQRRLVVLANLLLLIDGLGDVQLVDLALSWLADENMVIRYMAVRAVTDADVVQQLNATKADTLKLAQNIVQRLGALVGQSSPEVLGLIAQFAADVSVPEGEELLGLIADMRSGRYRNWTVKYELLDATILKLLHGKLSSGGSNQAALGRRFCQLYSCVIQRYVKGKDFLNEAQKQQLAAVLAEVENACIAKLLGTPQGTIKRAVEREDMMGLLQEHDRLLGDNARAGELPRKLGFDYGTDPDGGKRTAPLDVPAPPRRPEGTD